MCNRIEDAEEEANNYNEAFSKIKEEAKRAEKSAVEKDIEEERKSIIYDCNQCSYKEQSYEIRKTDTKAFAIRSLVELFSNSEEGEKTIGRKILLYFSLVFITIIFIVELGIIISQGLEILKLEKIVFLGTLGSITSAIIYTFKLISKYLYNNEKDKILETIEKLFDK